MECDNTHLNHNSLMSQKKEGHQGRDSKGGLLCIVHLRPSLFYISFNFGDHRHHVANVNFDTRH